MFVEGRTGKQLISENAVTKGAFGIVLDLKEPWESASKQNVYTTTAGAV